MHGPVVPAESPEPVRVAVDLLGGDGPPAPIIAGVLAALRRDPNLVVSLVGPEQLCRQGMADCGAAGERVTVVPASQVVEMAENPVHAVRDKLDATVSVAANLVRSGSADAMVTIGSTGAALAASIYSLGLLPGVTRPALAVTLPSATGDVVLLDVGANVVTSVPILVQHALVGEAYAQDRLAVARPRVGLLTVGAEPGKGDAVRRSAFGLLGRLPLDFVGNVEGDDVLRGGVAEVIVTDGFTGNVLLKGMEGTYALLASLLVSSLGDVSGQLWARFEAATAHLHPDRVAGATLLGVDGLVVVGHGASTPAAIAACIGQAAESVRRGVLRGLRTKLAAVVSRPAPSMQKVTP